MVVKHNLLLWKRKWITNFWAND